jgi:hypothetical protein
VIGLDVGEAETESFWRAKGANWRRQEDQSSGNPCSRMTGGPSPASTRWMSMPLACTVRCAIGRSVWAIGRSASGNDVIL